MNWFTDKIYDFAASPRAGEGAWSELAAQDAMSPATRASYYAGSEMPKDPRNAAWRSQPRMGDVAAMPGTADWMAPPGELARVDAPAQEVARRFAPQGGEISQGDAFWMGGGRPLPQRSEADAYRMAGLARTDQYKPNTFRDIDRADIEDQYGGADLHGIKLPPVSKDEPRAWFDAVVPQSPLDVGLMAAGPAGRLAGKGAAALTGAAGVMGELVDPAEAGGMGKLLRGKPGGPWEGGIRAYHSSPHDFDRFDWSKLRTGEGANTFGAGFYVAENPAVSGQGGQYWQQFKDRFPKHEMEAADLLKENRFNREQAINEVNKQIERIKDMGANDFGVGWPSAEQRTQHFDNMVRQLTQARDALTSGAPVGPRTYEVNIAARPELLLDWDKPLKQQPVAETVRGLVPRDLRGAFDANVESGITGSNAYHNYIPGERYSVSDVPGGPRRAVDARTADEALQMAGNDPRRLLHIRDPAYVSQTLAEAGIPGIRYLDQGSRPNSGFGLQSLQGALQKAEAAGNAAEAAALRGEIGALQKPTYNYVVTDPSKLDILAKYGVVGAAGAGIGALATQDQAEAAPFKKLLSSTSAFTPDKPGDMSWWHRIANRKLDRPLGDIPFEAVGNIPQVGRRVTPADLEGNFMMPLPGDPTHRGKTFTSIDDIRLSTPYTSQGGMPYIAATEGFANAPPAASAAANRVKRLEEKYDVPVIGSYLKMGPQSADFSSHTWAPLARMFPEAPMTKGGVKELNTDIRSRIAEFLEGARGEKFPGVKAGNLDAFLERQPDVYRKAVIGATEQARGNIPGVPDVVAVRYAMTHPDLLNAPASSSGMAMTRLTGETRPGAHTDYKTHLVGEGSFGLGMQLPREVAFPDWSQKIDKIPSYKDRPDRWLQAMYQKPPPKIPYGQELTPQWVDRTSQYMEDVPKMGETAALNKYVLQHFGWK